MSEQDDRVVLVTGASRGIGRAIALDQAGRGRHVVAIGRTEAGLAATVAAADAAGRITTVLADSMAPDSMGAVGDAVMERYGRLDAVVACAGVHGAEAPVAKLATTDWTEAFTINVVAPAQLLRGCIPHLVANRSGGHILVIGSNASVRSPAGFAVYNAGKAALHSLMRTLSRELDKDGVAVNELRPGPTNTSLLGGREGGVAAGLLDSIGKAFGREWLKSAADVASAAAFLLDLPPSGTTGQTLTLNRYE